MTDPYVMSDEMMNADEERPDLMLWDREAVLERFRPVCRGVVDKWIETKATLRERNRQEGFGFNPLEISRLSENQHSQLLGTLLDPNGSHGQGTLFLSAFLSELDVADANRGTWRVSIELGRVDIMLWRDEPKSVILIENKACLAVDQQSQLYRYWYEQVYRWNPNLNYQKNWVKQAFKVIYLVPSTGKVPVDHSLRRPDELKADDLPEKLPIQPRVMTLRDLVGLWNRECRTLIPRSNRRLNWLLDCYSDLWNL